MATTVVTQEQWFPVMGFRTHEDPTRGFFLNGQHWKIDYPRDIGPRKPLIAVNRREAMEFCEKLSSRTGRRLRLPTEAEWERACRAGTSTLFSFGTDVDKLPEYAVFGREYGDNENVAARKPNPWGLYDVHGNVWEWVSDYYGPFSPEPQTDPQGPAGPFSHVRPRLFRGGCSVNGASNQRSAERHCIEEEFRNSVVGFRVLMEAEGAAAADPRFGWFSSSGLSDDGVHYDARSQRLMGRK